MIKTKPIKRVSFNIIIVICVLLGALIGTGIAYADNGIYPRTLWPGTITYLTHIDESIWSGEEYDYWAWQRITLSTDRSDVTFVTGSYKRSTTYTNANSNYPDEIVFGPLWIYDEYGHHSVLYLGFLLYPVDGFDDYWPTYWFYGNMNPTNNYVLSEQYIWSTLWGIRMSWPDIIIYRTQ